MTATLFSQALTSFTDHEVSFASDGTSRGWAEFVSLAGRACAALEQSEGERWAIDLDDPFDFAAGLIGCWAAGKTAVIAPRPMIETAEADVHIDGLLGASIQTAHRRCLDFHALDGPRARSLDLAAGSRLDLYTSGSTGRP